MVFRLVAVDRVNPGSKVLVVAGAKSDDEFISPSPNSVVGWPTPEAARDRVHRHANDDLWRFRITEELGRCDPGRHQQRRQADQTAESAYFTGSHVSLGDREWSKRFSSVRYELRIEKLSCPQISEREYR